MRSSLTGLTTLALTAAGAVLICPTAADAHTAAPAARGASAFALAANGFGTHVSGGDLPAGSDATAFTAIGCTNKVGLERENSEASQVVPGLGVVKGVKTRVWTVRKGNVVSSYSRHTVASLTLLDTPLGQLKVNAITSLARAYHDARGFHAKTSTSIGSISFDPVTGPKTQLRVPTANRPLVVPGVASISVGSSNRTHSASGARARANALDIRVIPLGTRARVANAKAQISGGVKSGVFGGWSAGTKATGLADTLRSGKTPLLLMPCQGTAGKVVRRSAATVDLGSLTVRGVTTAQRAASTMSRAWGYEQGRIASINLGDGALVVKAISARANVSRTSHGVVRTAKGTSIGAILVNGETVALPASGKLTVPGVASLQTRVVKRTANGISVVALRLTVLDGTGAVVDLGQASLKVRSSGL